MLDTSLISSCHKLLKAYKDWLLGNMKMPEDVHPNFAHDEERLVYFTLPMALNYQRNSYALREWATKTYDDAMTRRVFAIQQSATATISELQTALWQYKIALQPNKHTATWATIAKTIHENRWSVTWLLESVDYDFLKLQQCIQKDYKKWFPYLSWPKIFHYRCYILGEYCSVVLKNKQYIDIAPDTHVIQCSVKLGVITEQESQSLSREDISQRWRDTLAGTWITPIDMHSPLWFWSRNNFIYVL